MLKRLYLKGNSNEITSILQLLNKFEGTNKEVGKKFEKLLLFDRNHRMDKKNPPSLHRNASEITLYRRRNPTLSRRS